MDIVYRFVHSRFDDLEIRYSLRSVEAHLPYVNKVWIFGDRPRFLTGDTSLVEHVPQSYTARLGAFQLPVRNNFLLLFLSSMIPELSYGHLSFADDYIILDDVPQDEMLRTRFLGNLRKAKSRGKGLWKESLWRTSDVLKRFGYSGFNFEVHTPIYYEKKWIFDAYCEFRDFVTDDPHFGLKGATTILNRLLKYEPRELVRLKDEGRKVGFYKPQTYKTIAESCEGKWFLNYDEKGTNDDLKKFLQERFPTKSRYEK